MNGTKIEFSMVLNFGCIGMHEVDVSGKYYSSTHSTEYLIAPEAASFEDVQVYFTFPSEFDGKLQDVSILRMSSVNLVSLLDLDTHDLINEKADEVYGNNYD